LGNTLRGALGEVVLEPVGEHAPGRAGRGGSGTSWGTRSGACCPEVVLEPV